MQDVKLFFFFFSYLLCLSTQLYREQSSKAFEEQSSSLACSLHTTAQRFAYNQGQKLQLQKQSHVFL